jgi:hypothetical protein
VFGQWTRNGLRFATHDEALRSARDLMMRWFTPTDARATRATEPVSYRITTEGDVVEVTP